MGIFEKLTNYFARQHDLAELDALSAQDLADFAASRAELREALLSRPGVRAQLLAMAARYGLTEDDIGRPHWRDLEIVHTCQHCRNAKACKRFLAGKATSFVPSDCPNATTYAEIAAEKT